jgi:hypothetical protein
MAARKFASEWDGLDAGQLREVLAEELAEWRARGFATPSRATRWHRYSRRLARLVKRPLKQVLADLWADADSVADQDEPE